MSYHDYGYYKTKWSTENKEKEQNTKNPSIKVLSPQKKLYDIQQIINSLSDAPLTSPQLSEAIQKILDGE